MNFSRILGQATGELCISTLPPTQSHRVSEGGVVAGWASEFESSKTGQMLAHVTNRVFQFDVMESSAATVRFSKGLVDMFESVVI